MDVEKTKVINIINILNVENFHVPFYFNIGDSSQNKLLKHLNFKKWGRQLKKYSNKHKKT